jgi:hypothetical protein
VALDTLPARKVLERGSLDSDATTEPDCRKLPSLNAISNGLRVQLQQRSHLLDREEFLAIGTAAHRLILIEVS